jgi:hypothetical protein
VTDDDEVAAVANRLDDGVRVLRPAGGGVLLRQVDGDGIVAVLAERRDDEVPVPSASAAAVDEREGGHGGTLAFSRVSERESPLDGSTSTACELKAPYHGGGRRRHGSAWPRQELNLHAV